MSEMENFKQQNSKSQQLNIKAFETLRKNLTNAGIGSNSTNQSWPFNGNIFYGFIVLGYGIFFTSAFIIYEAESIADYTQSVYAVSLLTLISVCFLILIFNVKKFFEFINRTDNLINTSE